MLKFAQNGDLSSLKNSIECGADINYQDKFGWTALMCASVESHVTTVRFLLKIGADTNVTNNSKQTAIDLARKSKRSKIVDILEKWDPDSDLKKKSKVIKTETYFCEICEVEYSDKIKHESSTAHLFNRQLKPSAPHFTIPESNKGFQLMLKHGWNKTTGLGSKGQGPKYPVKTVLKRDRQGFGGETKQKSKVTHFDANDASAVERCKKNSERRVSVRTLSRREARYREKKDKNWEREMRRYFNSD
ncbi:hypothetical protein LOTGIDRAFT_110007 [Lottia gigantea]|uniref:G-patch domain-containing protein n=1 Tax=Lottia gigantea TaxID=225164 RepID=V4CNH9_LOTGI|nr:hypothetical protein LOTGIDRAFT_110007 [Lottia gigantea]ESP03945.1 hypothetical protein LOTGIDRAFT_110007 [Lottia gigantea]